MTDESNSKPSSVNDPGSPALPKEAGTRLVRHPGLVAIGLYMFLLAGVVVVYVVQGRVGPFFLVFSALFIAGGLGLMMLLRWAWALTLAAVAILSGLFFWISVAQHLSYFLVHGGINLILFLYLVRSEVRANLR